MSRPSSLRFGPSPRCVPSPRCTPSPRAQRLPTRRPSATLLAVGLGVALGGLLAGCGDDLGPEEGRAEAFVGDDPGTLTPAIGSRLRVGPPPAASAGVRAFTGTAAGDFQAAISADGATWVELGSPNGITVALQSGERVTVHGEQDVPPGTYSRVRLVLSDVEITVAAGSEIGGLVLEEEAKLNLATEAPLVVEREVDPFTVSSGGLAEILFELNAEVWLDQSAIQAGTVSAALVGAHVTANAAGS